MATNYTTQQVISAARIFAVQKSGSIKVTLPDGYSFYLYRDALENLQSVVDAAACFLATDLSAGALDRAAAQKIKAAAAASSLK